MAADSIDWRALYEWRLQEYEDHTRTLGQRLKRLGEECLEDKNRRTLQACIVPRVQLDVLNLDINYGCCEDLSARLPLGDITAAPIIRMCISAVTLCWCSPTAICKEECFERRGHSDDNALLGFSGDPACS